MPIIPELETEANIFACLLLMPEKHFSEDMRTLKMSLRDDKEIIKLAKKYEVPITALVLRMTLWNKAHPKERVGF